jgi:hypothetical protein
MLDPHPCDLMDYAPERPPIKLEAGKYYRDREGRVHGPLRESGNPVYRFSNSPQANRHRSWTEAGVFNVLGDGTKEYDLVAEAASPLLAGPIYQSKPPLEVRLGKRYRTEGGHITAPIALRLEHPPYTGRFIYKQSGRTDSFAWDHHGHCSDQAGGFNLTEEYLPSNNTTTSQTAHHNPPSALCPTQAEWLASDESPLATAQAQAAIAEQTQSQALNAFRNMAGLGNTNDAPPAASSLTLEALHAAMALLHSPKEPGLAITSGQRYRLRNGLTTDPLTYDALEPTPYCYAAEVPGASINGKPLDLVWTARGFFCAITGGEVPHKWDIMALADPLPEPLPGPTRRNRLHLSLIPKPKP